MKKDKKKKSFMMALQNLKARKFRTGFMMFFVVLMSATCFFSTLLMDNMELGIKNTTERMGADIIVVPEEGTEELRDSLFAGVPCSLFFDKKSEDAVRQVPGVERVSPQLYIATLSASCCDAAVQLIAFVPETDFVVTPWLGTKEALNLKKGEVVTGADVQAEVGQSIRFYGIDFTVARKLERTGMGYDNSVFMTFDTATMLKESTTAKGIIPVEEMDDNITMLMVDIQDGIEGVDLAMLQKDIQNSIQGEQKMRAYTADDLMSGIASQVKKLSGYGTILTYIIIISTALALISIFVITINERKYEFGILCTLGASRRQIAGIIVAEALMISVISGIVGVIISWYGIITFKDIISIRLEIPYLDTGFGLVAPIAIGCIAVAVITGIVAAICSVYRISKGEPYRLIRESE